MFESDDLTYMIVIHDLCALPPPSAQNREQRVRYIRLRSELWQWIHSGENPAERKRLADSYEARHLRVVHTHLFQQAAR